MSGIASSYSILEPRFLYLCVSPAFCMCLAFSEHMLYEAQRNCHFSSLSAASAAICFPHQGNVLSCSIRDENENDQSFAIFVSWPVMEKPC